MGMRITTNMLRRNYTNNLMENIGGLEKARQQVETGEGSSGLMKIRHRRLRE